MPNDIVAAAVRGFQQKLDSFKSKVELQKSLTHSLAAEFESLTSEFESLKQLFGDSLHKFEATSSDVGATSGNFESTSEKFGATSSKFDVSLEKFGVTSLDFGVTSFNNEATSENSGVTSQNFESSSENSGATSPKAGSVTIGEMALLVQRSAGELKIYFGQPNIPNRIAEILRALIKKNKLSVAEMRRITGASRNSLVRDIKILKLLGWIEFHGSRKNGYFTLTAAFPRGSCIVKEIGLFVMVWNDIPQFAMLSLGLYEWWLPICRDKPKPGWFKVRCPRMDINRKGSQLGSQILLSSFHYG